MITAGEFRIQTIAAVLEGGRVIPPCGRCRELIYQIDKRNARTRILISNEIAVTLKELLPHHPDDIDLSDEQEKGE
jgi:cytidine deaminase